MKLRFVLSLGLGAFLALSNCTNADIVTSNTIEDVAFTGGPTGTDRNETILNNSGTNTGRVAAARFDTSILSVQAFTDSTQYVLNSATLRFHEESRRNANNGTQNGFVGGFFLDTAQNSDWTTVAGTDFTSVNSGGSTTAGGGWYGNTAGRDGTFGGVGTGGNNNADNRTNGAGATLGELVGSNVSSATYTFDSANTAEVIDVDLTAAGASLAEIQLILADWVAGNNAGIGLYAEFGNQAFFTSSSVASGNSVGSDIDGNTAGSGLSLDGGGSGGGLGGTPTGGTGVQLILDFSAVAVPEPSSLALLGLVGMGFFTRRRK